MMQSCSTNEPSVSTNVIFAGSLKVCKRCGLTTYYFYFATPRGMIGGHLCPNCKYELHPPEIFLQKIQNQLYPEGQLYDPRSRRYETDFGLKDLQSCGWFIKERVIYEKTRVYPRMYTSNVIELIRLRYYGDRKCKRVINYKFWPESNAVCNCIYCHPPLL